MIAVTEELDSSPFENFSFVGELALDGAVRPVKGVLPVALEARRRGKRGVLRSGSKCARSGDGRKIDIYGVQNLRQTFAVLARRNCASADTRRSEQFFATHQSYDVDFSDVKGQGHVKRAIEVAVAGGHNVLMIGPPGSGKSMLSKRIADDHPAAVAGRSDRDHQDPQHRRNARRRTSLRLDATVSLAASHHQRHRSARRRHVSRSPGEVSIAHNGVLFLDELPEFKRSALEVMRQPLEDGKVTISRAAGSVTFPSEFMLVAAMNPCPCGYFGDLKRECRCGPVQVQRYRQRISGPLLDRIDLHIEVPAVEYRDVASERAEEASAAIRDRIMRARERQQERFRNEAKVNCNARMATRQLKQHCKLGEDSQELIRVAMTELNLSARAYDRILKVSRTIADLDGKTEITPEHVSEAIQYRTFDRTLWV